MTVDDLSKLLKSLQPRPAAEPVIFEEHKYDQIKKEVEMVNSKNETTDFLIKIYDKLIHSFQSKTSNFNQSQKLSVTDDVISQNGGDLYDSDHILMNNPANSLKNMPLNISNHQPSPTKNNFSSTDYSGNKPKEKFPIPLISSNTPKGTMKTSIYNSLPKLKTGNTRPVRSLQTAAKLAKTSVRSTKDFAIPSLFGKHLNSPNEAKNLSVAKKQYETVSNIQKIIQKMFDSFDPDEISVKLEHSKIQKSAMNSALQNLEEEINLETKKHFLISANLDKAEYEIRGFNRMLFEGNVMLESYNENLSIRKQELKELDMQNKMIKKSIKKIASSFELNMENDDIETVLNILKVIFNVFQSNRSILPSFRQSQKQKAEEMTRTKLSKKVQFNVVDSTSNIKKLSMNSSYQQNTLSFTPASLNDFIIEENTDPALSSNNLQFDLSNMMVPSLSIATTSGTNLLFSGINTVNALTSINSNSQIQDYVPKTRSTRRAFMSTSSLPSSAKEDESEVNKELSLIGSMIGHIFVDRFSPEFLSHRANIYVHEREEVEKEVNKELDEKLGKLSSIEIMKLIFEHYRKYTAYLHLLAFEEDEIKQMDRSFIRFVATRDQYILALLDDFDKNIFLNEVTSYIIVDETAALWLIRDFVRLTDAVIIIPKLVQKAASQFTKAQNNIDNIVASNDRTLAIRFIPWIACMNTFLEAKTLPSTHRQLLDLCNENLSKLGSVFAKTQATTQSRAGLLVLFKLATYCPFLFTAHISFQNKATSVLHYFMITSMNFPSCIKVATEFFIASLHFLEEESIMWHTAVFFHYVVNEITREYLREDHVKAFVEAMTMIVANRQKYTKEQLGRLNFLIFMIHNMKLEETVDLQKNDALSKTNDTKKTPSLFPSSRSIKNISYLDLPKFEMPNGLGLPKLNLENPKLQLHFIPIVDEANRVSKSTKISLNAYKKIRKKYPIYISHEVHCSFIQMMFSMLIDHSLHRLDVYFCDPFPQVNRKPNVLYTLMRHMEMKINFDVAKSLEQEFTPPDLSIDLQNKNENDGDEEEEEEDSRETQQIQLIKTGRTSNTADIFRPHNSIPKNNNTNTSNNMISNNNSLETVKEEDNEDKFAEELITNDSSFQNIAGHGVNKLSKSNKNDSSTLSFGKFALDPFRSLPNFIASANDDDIALNSSVRSSDRQEAVLAAFKTEREAQFQDYQRLLRMSVPELFKVDGYQNGTHVASGAFGAVMAVTLNDQLYAVKVLEKSRNEFDNPHLVEVYTEVSILERCKGDRRVTQLYDYGCTADSYYIVMEYYPSTLKSWRKKYSAKNEKPPDSMLLRIYREFLNAATILTDHRINHFDIKCDNVMLDRDGYPALADFGEAMSYKNESNDFTLLNKGTEWIKSPEMLSIALNSSTTNPNFDRRKRVGAGPASDIWSIGCLFFELITGEFLFLDSDWSRFFLRITDPKKKILTEENITLLDNPKYCSFLEFVLQRSVIHRPNLTQVIVKFDEMFPNAMDGELPKLSMPTYP